MLERIKKGNPLYPEAQRLIHFFEPFRELSDDFVPDNSILREFIGYKKINFRKKKVDYIDKRRYNGINKFGYK